MFGEDYAYAVARIRVLETGLLNQAAIEQLLACQDEQQCLQILTEKGWGIGYRAAGADAILSREREKIWEIMDSLVADRSVFSVLRSGGCPGAVPAPVQPAAPALRPALPGAGR